MPINVLDGGPEWSVTRRFTMRAHCVGLVVQFRLNFRGNQSHHLPRHLRIKPAHAIRPYREIRRVKGVRPHEFPISY